ncbi:MAG: hypothetical protein EBR27_12900 [Betaproteobacteria bacterium]|nr:hypothetical protein [Betaproteobacteria bacterium]
MDEKTAKAIANVSFNAGALAAGNAIGGSAGATAALNVDANNRQLHPTEKQRIKDLAKGDAKKEARLTAAACALVRCYAEYAEGSAIYTALKAMADAGSSDAMTAERQQLQRQQGLFNYSTQGILSDKNIDSAKQINNTYQVTTRAIGAGQAVLGGLGVAGSVATAPVSCATGVGCLANAVVGTISADAALAGTKQVISGQPENTSLNNTLQALGLSPEAAGYAEFALGIGAAAKVGSLVNATTTSQAANNTAAKLSYEPIEKFAPQGVKVNAEVMNTPQAQAIVKEYMAAGVAEEIALRRAGDLIQTGKALPIPVTVGQGVELIKVVPKTAMGGDAVSAYSPFFVTRQEFENLSRLSTDQIAQRLGIPVEQGVRGAQLGFDAYAITPKVGTTPKVFVSEVAPIQQGSYSATGGAQQVLVVNRAAWSDPVKIGTIAVGGNK